MRLDTQVSASLLTWFFFIEIYIFAYKAWILKNPPAERKVSPPKVRHKGRAALPLGQPLPPRRKTPHIPPVWFDGGDEGLRGAVAPQPQPHPHPSHPIPSRVCRRCRSRPLSAPGCHRDRSADCATPTRRCLRADGLGGAAGAALPPRPLRPNNGGRGSRCRAAHQPAAAVCAGPGPQPWLRNVRTPPGEGGAGAGCGGAVAGPLGNKEPQTATWRLVCSCPERERGGGARARPRGGEASARGAGALPAVSPLPAASPLSMLAMARRRCSSVTSSPTTTSR